MKTLDNVPCVLQQIVSRIANGELQFRKQLKNNDFLSAKKGSLCKGCGRKSFAQVVRFNAVVAGAIKRCLLNYSSGAAQSTHRRRRSSEATAIKQITVSVNKSAHP